MLELTEMMAMTRPAAKTDRPVLLVEPGAGAHEQFGSWLEAAGYGVINCPGPPGAGMVCLRQRGRAAGERTPDRRLIHYYLTSGKPVILLGDTAQLGTRYRDDQVALLPRQAKVSRRTFIKTIRRLEAIA